MTGKVKWFDPVKGYGFIERDGGGPDVLMHANVVRNFGRGCVAEGSLIKVMVINTPRGLQADSILSITPPEYVTPEYVTPVPLESLEHITAEEVALCPLQPARIKWFDRLKGFGFAKAFGQKDDIFLHLKIVRRGGLANVKAGEAVGIRVMKGRLGRIAVEVLPWNAGLKS